MGALVYVLFGVSVFIFFILVLTAVTRSRLRVGERLSEIEEIDADDQDEMRGNFLERAIKPLYQGLMNLVSKLTPANMSSNYETLIIRAGLSRSMTPIRLLLSQFLLAAVLVGIRILIFVILEQGFSFIQVLILAVIGFALPWLNIKNQADKRSDQIRKSLPDFLDMLYVSVEAGLGFDAALRMTAEKFPGPFSEEIMKSLYDISKGRDRKEALRAVSYRTQVKEVNSFITAVIQAEALGSDIASMLRVQSEFMRINRQQWAQTKAAQMPMKMLFPLIFLMLPALFIVILGPALLGIFDVLG
ncbi:MAG: type II secretion system F family protein [Eubacteriales bacterium]|nr:type II secretion system F family protein [Eubacteriales bacterium]MDD4323448.1 type II secretion system F family protein [Eubacteriales bacterium]